MIGVEKGAWKEEGLLWGERILYITGLRLHFAVFRVPHCATLLGDPRGSVTRNRQLLATAVRCKLSAVFAESCSRLFLVCIATHHIGIRHRRRHRHRHRHEYVLCMNTCSYILVHIQAYAYVHLYIDSCSCGSSIHWLHFAAALVSVSFSVSVLLSAFALDACVRVCVLPVVILCVVALAILHFLMTFG